MELMHCYVYSLFSARLLQVFYRLSMSNISEKVYVIRVRTTIEGIHCGYFFKNFYKVVRVEVFSILLSGYF